MSDLSDSVDRRVLKTRQSVIEAAQRLLFDGGPTALTYSALAEEAKVGRATLYRHWPTIDELWSEIAALTTDRVTIELSGDLRSDLLTAMGLVEQMARTEAGRANFVAMLERSQWDDETFRFMKIFGKQTPVYQALCRGVEEGTYPYRQDLRTAANQLLGPLLLEALFTRGDFSSSLVEQLVDRFLDSEPLTED